MSHPPKVLLIGGPSHAGKSTLAMQLAKKTGWNCLSTDQLARHPGRPWRTDSTPLPDDVVAHYAKLSTVELVDSVLQHYRSNVWPIVEGIVHSHLNNPFDPCLVFEGSAILPELAAAAQLDGANCIWLIASDDLITRRVLASSDYAHRPPGQQELIQAFLDRALRLNAQTVDSVERLNLNGVDADSPDVFERMVLACE